MKENNIVLVSRALALYLLCWAASEITYLPVRILEIWHHLYYTTEHAPVVQKYLQDVYVIGFGLSLIRLIFLVLAAGWLYRCGPRVKAFFLEPTPEEELS